MAGPTFSITFVSGFASANSGISASNAQLPTAQIDDTNETRGIQSRAMSRNSEINVRGSDGVTRNCTIDSYRSDPSKGLIYYLPTGH
jgi:hypothetical protein